jgi:hypothetical protein
MKQFWRNLWWALLYPIDCLDPEGKPDHGKLAATGIGILFAILILRMPRGVVPPLAQTVAFIAGLFGPRMFYRFLNRGSWAVTETQTLAETIARNVAERKQGDGTTQATP